MSNAFFAVISRSAVAAGFSLFAGLALAAEPLVTPDWVDQRLGADDIVVLDLRTAIANSGRDDYLKAHIPGAIWSNYPGAWRTTRNGVSGVIPSVEKLEAYLSELGVSEGKTVVLVPAGKGSTDFGVATRIYWTLKYLGHDDVSILNGGWKAWSEAGLATETGNVTPEGDLFVADIRDNLLVETPAVESLVGSQSVLLDGRPEAQYRGKEKHSAAARYGRIPGAMSLDQNLFYDAQSERLKDLPALKASVPAALAPDAAIVSYCNTGHWAATNWFVLHELLGYANVTLYDESMVGWTADAARRVDSERTRLDDLKAWLNGLFS
jgi:thiosulfate/3-mercaptopyruvate sulfurtransferase